MKYEINKEQDIEDLISSGVEFVVGDIVVHKPFEFYTIVGMLKKKFENIELVPVSPGTECYAINGYNTSVITQI